MAQGFFKVGVTFLLCWVCKTKFYNSMADTRELEWVLFLKDLN